MQSNSVITLKKPPFITPDIGELTSDNMLNSLLEHLDIINDKDNFLVKMHGIISKTLRLVGILDSEDCVKTELLDAKIYFNGKIVIGNIKYSAYVEVSEQFVFKVELTPLKDKFFIINDLRIKSINLEINDFGDTLLYAVSLRSFNTTADPVNKYCSVMLRFESGNSISKHSILVYSDLDTNDKINETDLKLLKSNWKPMFDFFQLK